MTYVMGLMFEWVHIILVFIGDDESKLDWLKNCTETLERNIHTISKSTGKYTQESYAAVVIAIQLEWCFIQRVTKNMGETFLVMEKMLWETFLPHIFFGKSKTLSPIVGILIKVPVKKYGLEFLNPLMSMNKKCLSLQRASTYLI